MLVVAVLALRNPKQPTTQAGTDTRTVTETRSPTSPASGARSSSPSTGRSSGGAASHHAAGSQPLVVLNDTTIANLARDAAARFERGGWRVTSYDENYRNSIISTCAYYDPAVNGAFAAARALQRQFPTIRRVLARFAQLPQGPVVVVLTSDYAPG